MKKFEITYQIKHIKKAVIEDTKIVYAENELQAVSNLSMLLNDIYYAVNVIFEIIDTKEL